jgi:hypothetical protein
MGEKVPSPNSSDLFLNHGGDEDIARRRMAPLYERCNSIHLRS